MGWLQSLFSPLKKLWFRKHSTAHKKSTTQSSISNDCVHLCFSAEDIYILHEDVKSCQYEDVHVLWSILVDSQTPPLTSKR
ncbi:hypothetical protein POTOM_045125 [Populus tomentosa]|uniref:Uncharacterized protein n=1 Tax=Populus tomentosa TaxID=118781 RepID=A0A8X8CDP4_POPTO|nr:hypothetical protein POTOM_045125 [Populus tomentosa]